MYTVYMHVSKTTNKKYVGITCREPWERRFNGNGSGYKNCIHFWNAIKLYGWNDFEHIVLQRCESEKEAMRLERYYIALYKTNDNKYGYNIKEGGEHQTYPKEIRDKISKANKGKQSPTKGRSHTEDEKRRISESQKGRKMPKDRYNAMCERMRSQYKGKPTFHMPTEEENKRLIERSVKKVRIIETNQVFNSMSECADFLKVHISNLSRAIRFNKKYKGFHYELA